MVWYGMNDMVCSCGFLLTWFVDVTWMYVGADMAVGIPGIWVDMDVDVWALEALFCVFCACFDNSRQGQGRIGPMSGPG